jgi:hypothetical protein
MDSVIDEPVFSEGFEAELKMHLYGALSGAIPRTPVRRAKRLGT